MQNLNVHTVPLRHKNLIEASAGTGKTWTLSFLYLRLILQEGYLVSQILVVTYTNAATDELRDRIRQRLVEAKQAFQQPHEAQAEYVELLANTPDHALALQHLQRAILSFDESAVFTIHGFCQRALVEQAFEAGLPFEHELIADDADLQHDKQAFQDLLCQHTTYGCFYMNSILDVVPSMENPEELTNTGIVPFYCCAVCPFIFMGVLYF